MVEGPIRAAGGGDPTRIQQMFARIAGRYDLLNRTLALGTDVRWRRDLVDAVRAALGEQTAPLPGAPRPLLLDVATGTADVALTLADEFDGGGRVVGVDFAAPMVRLGQVKAERTGHLREGRIRLLVGDATALPFAAASFDAVTIAFGIRNIPNRKAALHEMARVLVPGGLLAILEFGVPRGFLGRLFRFYFHAVLPRLGGLVSGHAEAYRYLPLSVDAFPPPSALVAELQDAGFRDARFRNLSGGIVWLLTTFREGVAASPGRTGASPPSSPAS